VSDQLVINNSVVRLMLGDITELAVDAFVYYARHDLLLGSGFGGAIAVRGGPKISDELKTLGPLETTGVTATTAGNLKAKYIIHAVGPRFQEADLEHKLRETVHNGLRLAEEMKIVSIAFPAMGVGFYAIPLEACAKNMFKAIGEFLGGDTSIGEVIICLNDLREYKPFQKQLRVLADGKEVTA
jgi:O-acetyl-ADP-ribose deacetylase (regulator of RNase III)